MTNLISVESRFLRKAWYIILENFKQQLPEYQKFMDASYLKLTQAEVELFEDIVLQADKLTFDDHIEEEWVKQGIGNKEDSVKLTYPKSWEISHLKKHVCTAIQRACLESILPKKSTKGASKKNADMPGRSDNLARREGRVVTNELHLKLLVEPENGQTRFVKSTSDLSEEAVHHIIAHALLCLARKDRKSVV